MRSFVKAASLGLLGLAVVPAIAQNVISTQAGLINYTEGTVLLNDRSFRPSQGQFQQMREQDTLRTANIGRAEVLLSPGVFLRMGQDSSFRLVSSRLSDARLELISGTALVEAAEVHKGNNLTFTHGDSAISIQKNGLYRLETEPARLRVLSGKAVVRAGGKQIEVKGGRMVALDGQGPVAKFKKDGVDSLDAWSQRRSERLARANLAGTESIRRQKGLPRSGFWLWNSLLGTYTYIPAGMLYTSPYGYYFWRNYDQRQAMTMPVSGGGGSSSAGTSSGSGGTSMSSGPSSYAGSVAGSGGGGGNGGGGGGGVSSGGGSIGANPK